MNGRRSKRSDYPVEVSTVLEIPDRLATCPHCGGEVGLWSKKIETRCVFCDREIVSDVMTSH